MMSDDKNIDDLINFQYGEIDFDFRKRLFDIESKIIMIDITHFNEVMYKIANISAKSLITYIKTQINYIKEFFDKQNTYNKEFLSLQNIYDNIIELTDNNDILDESDISHVYTTFDKFVKIKGMIVSMTIPYAADQKTYVVCRECKYAKLLNKGDTLVCNRCNNEKIVKTITDTHIQFILESYDYSSRILCDIDYNLILKYGVKVGDHVSVIGYIDNLDDHLTFMVFGIKKMNDITLDDEKVNICINKIQKLRKEISDNELYEELINNFLSDIYDNNLLKESILLCLASPISDNERLHTHLLIVGDPALAKSSILSRISNMIYNAVYVTGKGSTSVGLSATVVKDTRDRWTLNAGALVKANKSVCCIDEFLTMKDEDMEILHEVMEQGTCSIAKANISTRLEAKTRVIAAMNPIYTIYDPYKSFFENVPLKESLISRFDIIIVVRDVLNSKEDDMLADYILNNNSNNNKFDKEFYKIYLNYLLFKYNYIPHITDEAKDMLKKYYINLRSEMRSSNTKNVYVTPRTLTTLKRLAIARARLLMKDKVDVEDVKVVIEFYHKCILTYSPDYRNPYVDYIAKKNMFIDLLKPNVDHNKCISKSKLIEVLKSSVVNEDEVTDIIRFLLRENILYLKENNVYEVRI